jgi:hypothetical protein
MLALCNLGAPAGFKASRGYQGETQIRCGGLEGHPLKQAVNVSTRRSRRLSPDRWSARSQLYVLCTITGAAC